MHAHNNFVNFIDMLLESGAQTTIQDRSNKYPIDALSVFYCEACRSQSQKVETTKQNLPKCRN